MKLSEYLEKFAVVIWFICAVFAVCFFIYVRNVKPPHDPATIDLGVPQTNAVTTNLDLPGPSTNLVR